MTRRERLIKAIKGGEVDRPPVIVPAGLVNSLPLELLESVSSAEDRFAQEFFGRNPEALSALSAALLDGTGFESLGLPYTMTVESEAYGGETECGPLALVPRPYEYPYNGPEEHESLPELDPLKDGRLPVVVETIKRLRKGYPDMPIIADIVAPVSLATSIMDTGALLKSFLNAPDEARAFLTKLTENSIGFLRAMLAAGADVVFITDPASTSDNLGPELFGEFAVPFINKLSGAATAGGGLPIVHICGRTGGSFGEAIDCINAPCLSLDDLSGMDLLAGSFSIMGGVSAASLLRDTPAGAGALSSAAILKGVSILSPSCGLSGATLLPNLKALTRAVRSST